ncbi:protein NLP1-like, partial [Capsicum annuum]|uniref:protein NLP1-like n=1 Tax=Capsicum annuum TaxID=4072 RepID=UPI001FB0EA0F
MKRAKSKAHFERLSDEAIDKAAEEFIRKFYKELRKQQNIIDVRFEEKAYTAGTSQVSLSVLSVETKAENPVSGKPVQIVDESPKFQCMQLDAKCSAEESPRHIVPSWGDCALPVSFQQRSITEHVNLKRKVDTGPSGQDLTIFELGNKQKMNKKYKKTWRIGDSVSLEDIKEQFGKKREEAAESLNVSISTFKRICREHGISRWPSSKIKRERLLLSSLSCNGTDRVAANTQMRITKGLTALASTFSVKSNQQKSRSSNLSVNDENGTSSNGNLLEKNENSDRENIMIQVEDSANQELVYIPQEFGPACDSLIPDVPTIL